MRTTPHSSWGAPCKGTIKTIVRSDGLKLPVRLELVELITILIDETERRGYNVKPGQTWGYSCRRIAGSSSWSNHAWGLAIDINAPSNPMTTRLVTDMPSWMPALWKSYGFRWGGDYSGRKDAMHYEFLGSVADAKRFTTEAYADFAAKPQPEEEEEVEAIKVEGDTTGALYLRQGFTVHHIKTPEGLTDLRKKGIVTPGPEKVISKRAFDELVKV